MAKKPLRPPPARAATPPAAVGPEDLEVAKREALLQLRIGRSAHLSTVTVSAALALDAILLLFLVPHLPALHASDRGLVAFSNSYYLVLPILGGLAVAAVGLASKWETFQFWPWEPHFSLSVGAFAATLLAFALYVLRVAAYGPTGHLELYPWLVLLSLGGTSAALVGVVATWTPWGARQWTSALTAILPIATVALLFAPAPGSNGPSAALAVALLVSAILYQTSGSFLHLVSSGTGEHEQAIVLSGQNRIARLADDVRQRDEAIRFREATLVKREAEVEGAEAALRRRQEADTQRQAELQKLVEADEARASTLATRERDVAGRAAALTAQAAALDARRKELDHRTEEVARQAPELAAREQRLARREGEVARREVGLNQRAEELERRSSSVAEGEARVSARRKEVDHKTAELLRREGELTARERTAGAGGSKGAAPGADLAAREARAQHLKTLLDEQNVELGRRAKDVSERAKALETVARQVAERQAALVGRESALAQREEDLQDRLKVADERRLQFESAVRDYQERLDEIGQQQVAAAQKGADLDRNLQSLSDREKALSQREARLREASSELDRREGSILLRERSVDADEAEVSLRRQEIAREGDLPFAGLLAVAAADRAEGPASTATGRFGRGRRARVPGEEGVVEAQAETGMLAPPSGRKYPDRLPTGTPRLDDLLLGGLPPKSHVVLVGDAFSGKEVALYAFVAEGLKRSEPALLVTASRSPAEVSESLGVVLPQFREYEQMHSVTWIDASGTGGGPAAGSNVLVAKSSDDRAGILTSLVQAAKQAEEGAKGGMFRVGFLGLSAILAHADERASFSFLQNVVGILKPRNALAMYALEAGALTEAQVESLLGRMDGAIVFRQERDRSFLSVKGFGDVATRDWVEVRATSRNLIVGSFALERIR